MNNNALTIYPAEPDGHYIILKDGSQKYFDNIVDATDGLLEEYPSEDEDES